MFIKKLPVFLESGHLNFVKKTGLFVPETSYLLRNAWSG